MEKVAKQINCWDDKLLSRTDKRERGNTSVETKMIQNGSYRGAICSSSVFEGECVSDLCLDLKYMKYTRTSSANFWFKFLIVCTFFFQVKNHSNVNMTDVIVDLRTVRTGKSTAMFIPVTSLTIVKSEAVTKVTHIQALFESIWKFMETFLRAWKRKTPMTVTLRVKPLPLVRHCQNLFIHRSRAIPPEARNRNKLHPFLQCRARPCRTKWILVFLTVTQRTLANGMFVKEQMDPRDWVFLTRASNQLWAPSAIFKTFNHPPFSSSLEKSIIST